jgi:hypothetical protein
LQHCSDHPTALEGKVNPTDSHKPPFNSEDLHVDVYDGDFDGKKIPAPDYGDGDLELPPD